jgi:protein O-mannosyl-transferase
MPESQNQYKLLAVCGVLLLAVGLVFGQTICHDFVNYDDDNYVYENPHVTHGLTAQDIAWAFTSKYAGNWHPLTWISHMLDYQIYGLSPGGHHLTNVLLHAATAISLFLVLLKMTGDLWPSAFAAAAFAIHPLRAESVAWVAERKDVLSGLFFMLTLAAYLGYVRRPFSPTRYLLVIVFFTLGLMAKPMLVTLPFVLLLLDYWPLGRMTLNVSRTLRVRSQHAECVEYLGPSRHTECAGYLHSSFNLMLEKVPLLVLAVASCAVTLWAQSSAIEPSEFLPLSLRLGNAAFSYIAYLCQFFYPVGLAVPYPHPESALSAWKVAGALLILAAISGGAIAWRRRYPYLFVGWFWYLGMLVPVIGLVQVGGQAMADRYTYLPQIGLCIGAAWGIARACGSWPHRRLMCGGVAALVLVILILCAWRQTSYWRNSETLWTHALACTSQNYVACNNLGKILSETDRPQEAIEYLQQALSLLPNYPGAYYNLGVALARTGRLPEAIESYKHAIRVNPGFAKAYYNLGLALVQAGSPGEAIEAYEQALHLDPNLYVVHNNLGNILLDAGRVPEAIDRFQKALALNPDYPEAQNNLGNALLQSGRYKEAVEHYRQTLRLKPDSAVTYYNLAVAYANLQQKTEARASVQRALGLARSQGQAELARQIEDWLNAGYLNK